MNLPTPYSPAHLTLRTIYLWSSPCDSLALDATLCLGAELGQRCGLNFTLGFFKHHTECSYMDQSLNILDLQTNLPTA